MKRYDGYIFDLDGTIYVDDQLIPGAAETIYSLRSNYSRVAFVSNKPLETRAYYAEKLTRLGIPTRVEEVINSSLALVYYLQQGDPSWKVFVIGEEPLLTELKAAGVLLSENPEEIDVVVASFDRSFNYHKLDIGFQALRRGAHFIATNADATCPVESGEIPDAGAVIGALVGCSKREVEFVAGKPSPLIVSLASKVLAMPAERCLMVGDRLETDILMGRQAGMDTALVLSGVTRREQLAASPVQPNYILESISAFLVASAGS